MKFFYYTNNKAFTLLQKYQTNSIRHVIVQGVEIVLKNLSIWYGNYLFDTICKYTHWEIIRYKDIIRLETTLSIPRVLTAMQLPKE